MLKRVGTMLWRLGVSPMTVVLAAISQTIHYAFLELLQRGGLKKSPP